MDDFEVKITWKNRKFFSFYCVVLKVNLNKNGNKNLTYIYLGCGLNWLRFEITFEENEFFRKILF